MRDSNVVPFSGEPKGHPQRAKNSTTKTAIPSTLILPRMELDFETLFDLLLGMTSRQFNFAFYANIGDHAAILKILELLGHALDRKSELENAMHALRLETIQAMARNYPAAARRIIAGKPRRRTKH
jgi:hypothetical protein